MTTEQLKYRVGTLRAAGLEAKWGRNGQGAPMLFARDPSASKKHQRAQWWAVDRVMWEMAKKHGIKEAFDGCTILGDFFSVPA